VLFTVAVCALLSAAALTAVALTRGSPEKCCVAVDEVSADLPSPTSRTSSSRPTGQPICLVGTWRTVEETFSIKFYTDQPAIPFVGGGRRYELHADGTGTEFQDNVLLTGSFQGRELRMAGNGTINFTWKANDHAITYLAQTSSSLTYSYYDQRGLISTKPLIPNANLNEVDDYACQGTQMTEGNDKGYRSRWSRIAGTGVYG
jgi:hypothetical protein